MADLKADILIAGGGMVGLPLGIALAKGGLSVALAEPMREEQLVAESFDGRVSALSFSSVRMFEALGIWPLLAPHAQPINDIVVSDGALGRAPSPFSLHFDHREIGETLGAIAENRHIRASLLQNAREEKNLTLLFGTRVTSMQTSSASATATLSDGRVVHAKLAIAADGRESALREAQNIRVVAWDYPQTGIVVTVEHKGDHKGVAYEHFLPAGPFAILPLPGKRSSLVWTEMNDSAPALLKLPPDDFAEALRQRFGAHLGDVKPIGPRWSYPLKLHLARDYVRERFALVGDAAHGIHPIAGQGLNLGLKDVAALAETILDAARLARDYGALDVLKRYERWRRFDSFTLAASTDFLDRLFSNDIAPIRAARDLGLGLVDAIPPLRRFFMRHAGGDVGNLPRLLKGEAA